MGTRVGALNSFLTHNRLQGRRSRRRNNLDGFEATKLLLPLETPVDTILNREYET